MTDTTRKEVRQEMAADSTAEPLLRALQRCPCESLDYCFVLMRVMDEQFVCQCWEIHDPLFTSNVNVVYMINNNVFFGFCF